MLNEADSVGRLTSISPRIGFWCKNGLGVDAGHADDAAQGEADFEPVLDQCMHRRRSAHASDRGTRRDLTGLSVRLAGCLCGHAPRATRQTRDPSRLRIDQLIEDVVRRVANESCVEHKRVAVRLQTANVAHGLYPGSCAV